MLHDQFQPFILKGICNLRIDIDRRAKWMCSMTIRTILEAMKMDGFARMRLDFVDIYRRRTLFCGVAEELVRATLLGTSSIVC